MSISVRLIIMSTFLLLAVISFFGVISGTESRQLIDQAHDRLRDTIQDALGRTGSAQLKLLATTTRIALFQSDYLTMQDTIESTVKQDERLLEAGVVDLEGKFLAHSDRQRRGQKATSWYRGLKGHKVWSSQPGGPEEPAAKVVGKHGEVMNFAMQVENEGAALCYVFLSYSLHQLHKELAHGEKIKQSVLVNNLKKTISVGLISLLVGIVLTIFQGIRISRPIQALARQADRIAQGDLQARVEVKTRDEVGFLGDRFNFMAEQILTLMHQMVEKATMEKELELASAVQEALVPGVSVAEINGVEIAGYFRPATQCGGDWWNYYSLPDGRVMVIIGDVTGHGAASAMITAAAKGAASTYVTLTKGNLELTAMLDAMNIGIFDTAHGQLLMTCFAAIYDPRTRTLAYANAGHNFPYLFEAKTNKLLSLVARGNRMGDVDHFSLEVKEIVVNPGDTAIFFTDGIIECENVSGEEYGDRRFRTAIKNTVTHHVAEVRDQLVEKAMQFFGAVPMKDDITLIVTRFS